MLLNENIRKSVSIGLNLRIEAKRTQVKMEMEKYIQREIAQNQVNINPFSFLEHFSMLKTEREKKFFSKDQA